MENRGIYINHLFYSNRLIIIRTCQGALLSIGAPAGWLLIKWHLGVDLITEISVNWDLYAYMLFGTVFIFSLFGAYTGYKEQVLEYLSIHDPLTNFYNRRYFYSRLHEELLKAKRKHSPLSIVSFDLDHFKRINDTYGHAGGDLLLKAVGKAVRKSLRASEIIGRLGGEEFSIMFPYSLEESFHIVQRVKQAINDISIPIDNNTQMQITASFGIATLNDQIDENQLMNNADQALYNAKNSGRNCIKY